MRGMLGCLLCLALAGCGPGPLGHDYTYYPFPEGAPTQATPRAFDVALRQVAPAERRERDGALFVPPPAELWRRSPYGYFNALKIKSGAGRPDRERVAVAALNRRKLDLLYGAERRLIARARGGAHHPYVGLALSGRGIRSACFDAGVLQGLHEIGALRDFGYLSTVSGGSYVAAWYMAHVDEPVGDPACRLLPEHLLARGSEHLQHLGQFGNYLVASHASDRLGELALLAVPHLLAALPAHALLNGILDCDVNVGLARPTYRGGLARCFLYDRPFAWRSRDVPQSDRPCRKRLCDLEPTAERPFWIVNTHVELDDDGAAHKNRSGDAFELTPLWAGADAVGYVAADEPRDVLWWTQVPYAIAVSGAAVDYGSSRHSRLARVAYAALCLDVGYFVPGFNYDFSRRNRRAPLHAAGYWLTSLRGSSWLWDAFWRTCGVPRMASTGAWHGRTPKARGLRLTDGGHFDNLGVYALVRRGCRLVIVSDSTYDPCVSDWDSLDSAGRAATFRELRLLEQKLEADFGAHLVMEWDTFRVEGSDASPGFGLLPRTTVFKGVIRDLPIEGVGIDDVTVIYIKAAYRNERRLLDRHTFLDAMKVSSPAWPHETTYLQFYDERRVLAYRVLGREMVLRARVRRPGGEEGNLIALEIERLKKQLARPR